MRKDRLLKNRLFSIISVLLLLLSLLAPVQIVAQDGGSNSKGKMSGQVLEAFEADEQVTFLVKFSENADTGKAVKKAKKRAKNHNLQAYKAELMVRSTVVSELKTTALQSQQQVKKYLEAEEAKGTVAHYRDYFIVNGIAVTATKEVAEKIASFNEVEKILPNEQRELYTTESKEAISAETDADEDIEWNVDRIGAPEVWDMGINGTGTVVASIDSGVQWDHPALKEKYRGYNPETSEVDHEFNWYDATAGKAEPYDDVGHGTHVTGTMVGGEADGSNQIGVAPGANWISVKAFTGSGGTDADLLDAAEWIIAPTDADGNERVDMAPDVVNNSWGGGAGLDEWYRDVVIAWRDANIFPEFSAGNTDLYNPGGPGSIASPANYPESFATGATDHQDDIADFSLRGPSPYSEIKPDISAPGVNIRSAVPGSDYDLKNGTSMAGPAVSAVVALLRQVNGHLSVSEIEEILLDTAIAKTDDEYPESPNNGYGHGVINAFDAVSLVADGLGAIEGTVSETGNDDEEPTYEHDLPLEAYRGMDTNLSIQVKDNISVLSVQLAYKINDGAWETVDAPLWSGDFRAGEYEAEIAGEELEEGTLTYKWLINDYGNNEVTSEEYEVPISAGITPGYFEDFEEAPIGWTSFGKGNDWEWGVPTFGPESAASGEKVYATNPDGSYTKDANATLVMPAIDLPEGEAYLNFDLWYDLEEVHDAGYVYVSTDQEEWKSKKTIFYDSDGWENVDIDLSEYSGERIYIGFNIASNTPNEITKPGIYLDNVGLSEVPQTNGKSSGIEDSEKALHAPADLELDLEKTRQNKPVTGTPSVEAISPAALPLNAKVSVEDTSRTTGTNPADGSYILTSLTAGEYTVRADAYGFQSAQQEVAVESDETTAQHFLLDETPKGSITGTVKDADTGEAVDGATLLLVEDANIAPVESDENGHYNLTAYEGTYTLKIIAGGYHYGETEVTIDKGDTEVNIELDSFYSYADEEIAYDDGSGEIDRTFYDIGNRAAVKMSLPEDKDTAMITDGVFQFHNDNLPRPGPGSTEFAVEVWDASGEDGMPGEKLAGPIESEAIRDITEWTVIDLQDENIIVDGDFYMVYVQTKADRYSPALASDVDGPYAGRSYEHINGFWDQSNEMEGNYMIRARVAYEVEVPVITSPEEDFITNESDITIEGHASPSTTVQLLNNGEDADRSKAGDDGTFEIPIALSEGENEFTVVTLVDGKGTKESDALTVTLDTEEPALTIDSPQAGDKINGETVTVEGTVEDENLDDLEVNGEKAKIKDGGYSKRIMLDEGENTIKVVASDLAGNIAEKEITVQAKYRAPKVENLLPDEDVNLQAGETVKIEFDSETGLRTVFSVLMPLTNQGAHLFNTIELPMMETSEGHYVGYWTVPKHTTADGAVMEVKASDSFGNVTHMEADGKLFIEEAELSVSPAIWEMPDF